jgi:glycosyltransferase involved in cell wall biosynthesis
MLAYTFYESDNRVRRYAETLARRGDKVDVIALRGNSSSAVEILNNVRLYKIQMRARNETGRFSHLFRHLLFFWRSMFFLAIEDMKDHYDLVHVHSVPDFEVFAAWFPKIRGAKLILDIHDLVPEFYASKFRAKPDSRVKRLLLLVERMSARFADHVIAANHIWRDRLLARSVKDAKCTAILNYPDGSVFCRRGRTRTDGKFIMVYPGSLNHHQGVDLAIRALARIKDQAPQAELHIYGGGNEAYNLRKLAGELGLAERVRFNDGVSITKVAPIMENADLGIVPKRTDGFGNEAFSTKVLEFMAMGVPVVVSDSAVDRYYFTDRVVTFFKGNDEAHLAECVLEMIRDTAKREAQVKRADHFVGTFDWDLRKSEYLGLVDTLVASAKAGAGPSGDVSR